MGKYKDTPPGEAFDIVLRELRKKAEFTQENLAFEAEIKRNYVSLIELGRNYPAISVIFKLAKALDIKPNKLIEMVEQAIKVGKFFTCRK